MLISLAVCLASLQANELTLPNGLTVFKVHDEVYRFIWPMRHSAVSPYLNIKVRSGDVWPAPCRNVERPERRPTVLTTMSHCQAIVSRIIRVGIAATYCHFRWPAFRQVGIKTVTGCTRECWHSARSFSLARRPFRRPAGSGQIGHRPTVEPGRFATPTSRAFHICIGLNGVRRRCAR